MVCRRWRTTYDWDPTHQTLRLPNSSLLLSRTQGTPKYLLPCFVVSLYWGSVRVFPVIFLRVLSKTPFWVLGFTRVRITRRVPSLQDWNLSFYGDPPYLVQKTPTGKGSEDPLNTCFCRTVHYEEVKESPFETPQTRTRTNNNNNNKTDFRLSLLSLGLVITFR